MLDGSGWSSPAASAPIPVEIFSDRILHGGAARALDHLVSAAVELDGQVVVSHRPTLTRMTMGAMLPGTALIPGLAFQKKETTDTRTASFILAHPNWTIAVPIRPDKVSEIRPLAMRINQVADQLRAQPTPTSASAGNDVLDQLERIAHLLGQGFITKEQASYLRDAALREE